MALVVGIDIGRKSPHDAIILRLETARKVSGAFRFSSTPEGLRSLLTKALQTQQRQDEEIYFVLDSPGLAWVPVASYLMALGYKLYRPTADKVKNLRKATHRRNKTNRIDALTLARTLIVDPDGTEELFVATGKQAKLDGLLRQRERLVDSIARRKMRIPSLLEAINPYLVTAMGSLKFTEAGRAFLKRYADPRGAVKLGRNRLARFLQRRYRLPLNEATVDAIYKACKDAVALYAHVRQSEMMPFDEESLQRAVRTELQMLEWEERAVKELNHEISRLQRQLDPNGVLRSVPGLGPILAAAVTCTVGDIARFSSLTKHRGYAGLYPRVRKTGDRESTSSRISKMSSNRYKRYLFLAADNARKWDVEMAAFYHKCCSRGHTHTQAVCAVANGKLLPRIHSLLKKNRQAMQSRTLRKLYIYRDLSGNPISKSEAKTIIDAMRDTTQQMRGQRQLHSSAGQRELPGQVGSQA